MVLVLAATPAACVLPQHRAVATAYNSALMIGGMYFGASAANNPANGWHVIDDAVTDVAAVMFLGAMVGEVLSLALHHDAPAPFVRRPCPAQLRPRLRGLLVCRRPRPPIRLGGLVPSRYRRSHGEAPTFLVEASTTSLAGYLEFRTSHGGHFRSPPPIQPPPGRDFACPSVTIAASAHS